MSTIMREKLIEAIANNLAAMAKELNERRDDRDVVMLSHGEVEALIYNLKASAEGLKQAQA